MKLKLQQILEIKTKEELLSCQKYQKIRFKNTPDGKYEVYVGNILESPCSCGFSSIIENPITLMKQKDGTIIAKNILILNSGPKLNFYAIVQDIKPTDSDYQSILNELNMRAVG